MMLYNELGGRNPQQVLNDIAYREQKKQLKSIMKKNTE